MFNSRTNFLNSLLEYAAAHLKHDCELENDKTVPRISALIATNSERDIRLSCQKHTFTQNKDGDRP